MIVNNGYQIPDLGSDPWDAPINTTMEQITNVLPPAGTKHVTTEHDHSTVSTPGGATVIAVVGTGATGIVNIPNLPVNSYLATDGGHNLIGVTGMNASPIGPGTPGYLTQWGVGGTGLVDGFAHLAGSGNCIIQVPGITGQLLMAASAGVVLESSDASTTVQGQEVYLDSFSGSVLNAYVSLNTSPALPAASNCVAMRLATVDNIDLGVTGTAAKTDLYTVANYQIVVVTSVLVRGSNLSGVTVVPWCSVTGNLSFTFPIFDSRNLGDFGYDPMKNGYWFHRNSGDTTTDCFHLCYSGETIQFSVDVPGQATNQTVSVDLFGYIM